jgi:hypothetical protein
MERTQNLCQGTTLQVAEKGFVLYCESVLAIFRFRFRPVLIHFFASRIPTTHGFSDPLSGLRFCRNQLGQADQIRCGRV